MINNKFAVFGTIGAFSLFSSTAPAATNYIGDAAPEGINVTVQGATRADSVSTLTYILHTGVSLYTAPANESITITEVNYFADGGGTVTPFVVRFSDGGTTTATQLAANYEFLTIGDTLSATPGGVNNQAFTVGGSNPTISLNAGDVIAAGWFQNGTIVFQGNPVSGFADYVASGNTISSVGNSPTAGSDFAFDRRLSFNIGFDPVPEPSGVMLLGIGALGLLRRRR